MKKNIQGFTLIELTIVISLIGILMVSLSSLLNYNIIRFNENNRYFRYKLDARYAINNVENEIRKNYGTSFNSGKILANDMTVLVNCNPNDPTGKINYYFDSDKYGLGDGYGELRGQSGNTVIQDIKEFKIESINPKLVKISIKAGKDNSSDMFELVTYCRLYD